MPITKEVLAANSVLAALPAKDYQLLAGLEPVSLSFGEILCESCRPIKPLCFPSDSLISVLTTVDAHLPLEVELIRREGMPSRGGRHASLLRPRASAWSRSRSAQEVLCGLRSACGKASTCRRRIDIRMLLRCASRADSACSRVHTIEDRKKGSSPVPGIHAANV